MRRRGGGGQGEQLEVGFEGIDALPVEHEPSDTMRQIVSLRMPDALLERVEKTARARGVSPSSLMRALIAAGLDRSYAAVTTPTDLAAEVAQLRHTVERLAARIEGGGTKDATEAEAAGGGRGA
jgi:predicted transcriptional regulator